VLQGVKTDVPGADCFDLPGTTSTCTLGDPFASPFSVLDHVGGKGAGVLNQFSRILRTDAADGLRHCGFEAGDDFFLQ
jgi:hypothetical protein